MENEIIRLLEDSLVEAEDEVDLLKVRKLARSLMAKGDLPKEEGKRIIEVIDYKLDRVRYK